MIISFLFKCRPSVCIFIKYYFFLWIFQNFLRHLFYWTPQGDTTSTSISIKSTSRSTSIKKKTKQIYNKNRTFGRVISTKGKKVIRNQNRKVTKYKDEENMLKSEIINVTLINCNLVSNYYQHHLEILNPFMPLNNNLLAVEPSTWFIHRSMVHWSGLYLRLIINWSL